MTGLPDTPPKPVPEPLGELPDLSVRSPLIYQHALVEG